MGVGLNTMLAAVGATGVAASKVATSIKEHQAQSNTQISEANDADKNEMMAQKALINAERLKNLKLKNKNLRLKNRIDKQTLKKMQGGNE